MDAFFPTFKIQHQCLAWHGLHFQLLKVEPGRAFLNICGSTQHCGFDSNVWSIIQSYKIWLWTCAFLVGKPWETTYFSVAPDINDLGWIIQIMLSVTEVGSRPIPTDIFVNSWISWEETVMVNWLRNGSLMDTILIVNIVSC